jgi:asparagine synthase (glutamine-hydrolysing)
MSGLGGWLGPVDAPDMILSRISSRLDAPDAPTALSASRANAGIAVRARTKTGAIAEAGPTILAILGHPRWNAGASSLGDIHAVARAALDAYPARGPSLLESLRGDFALALLDTAAREALLAVDRMGMRNLTYECRDESLVFGSNLDVLAAHPCSIRELDAQSIYNYVHFHMVPGPDTVFRGQRRVPQGHCVRFRRGRVSVEPYWQMTFLEDGPADVDRHKSAFRSALRDATRYAADEDCCGAFLSGGTDSSTISGLLGEVTGEAARTYSIGFSAEGYDEMSYARIAARHFKTDHHEYYVTPSDVVDLVPRLGKAYDQPFGNASAVPTYYCARLAKEDGVERMLGGDGGDELYGGNARYARQAQFEWYQRVPGVVRKTLLEPMLIRTPLGAVAPVFRKARSYVQQANIAMPARYDTYNLLERLGPETVFTPDFLASVNRGGPLELLGESYCAARADSLINRMLALDFKFALADSDLPKVTRMCELAGVDIAFPMLDEEVVALSGRLHPSLKLRGTQLRYFFKKALRDFLPAEILTKEKHGFGLPVGPWLVGHNPLLDLAASAIASLRGRGIFNHEFLDALTGRMLREYPGYYGTMTWVFMMLAMWFDVRGAASGNSKVDHTHWLR